MDDLDIDGIILELILNGMGGHGLESCGTPHILADMLWNM